MKCRVFFLFVVVFVVSVSADESYFERYKKAFAECQADPATFLNEFDHKNIGPSILCLQVKFGIQKPNGDIDKEKLREVLKTVPGYDATEVDSIVEECGTRKGSTAEDAALNLSGCTVRHRKDLQHLFQ